VTPEERAARERKQKIFVVVGGLFLVAMLAFQLPKLLGGGASPEAAGTTTTSTVPGQVAVPATPGASTPTSARTPAALTTQKLTSFSFFKPKDPFVQQVVTPSVGDAQGTGTPGEAAGKEGGAKTGGTAKFSTGAKAASATIVTVNGVRQILEPGMKFPAGDPLFVLVAEKPGAKSVVVGIAGGAYSGGGKTTTLKKGKPLTLVNTTTGARYKISLVSVGSGEQPEQPPAEK
jgi:hypothetical protein